MTRNKPQVIVFSTLIFALFTFVAQVHARDMNSDEFLACSQLLDQIKSAQEQHQIDHSRPAEKNKETLEALGVLQTSVTAELNTLEGQERAGVPLPQTPLDDLRLARDSLTKLQQHYQTQQSQQQRLLQQSKDRLVAQQNRFRQQCLSGVKVPKSVFKKLCVDIQNHTLCGLFKK